MEYKKIAILKATMLLVLSLFCVTTYAKPEKIKYGKNILYVGETFKFQGEKVPYGQGMLTLFDRDKDIPTIEITGEFHSVVQDSKGMYKIEEASLRSTEMSIRSFSGTINYSIEADKNNSNVSLLFDGAINHSPILVAGKGISEIGVNELCLKLSYDKEQKAWNAQLENPNCEILDQRIPAVLSNLNYAESDIQTVISEVTYSNGEITFDNPTFKLKDGGSFSNNKLTFSDGSFFVLNENKWHGNKKLVNGVLSKNENNEYCQISYNDGSTYEGTIKSTLNELIKAREIGEAEYVDGVFASNGTSEKWINGESFTKRHERLTGLLDAELVAAVEDGSLSESAATQKQEELNRQREEERLTANAIRIKDGWFANRKSLTFSCKNVIGEPLDAAELAKKGAISDEQAKISSTFDALTELGMKNGDVLYDITVKLNDDNSAIFIFKATPSERTVGNNTIHYAKYGGKVRHYDYVADFCNRLNTGIGRTEGTWKIEKGAINIDDNKFIICDDNTIKLKFLELIPLKLLDK